MRITLLLVVLASGCLVGNDEDELGQLEIPVPTVGIPRDKLAVWNAATGWRVRNATDGSVSTLVLGGPEDVPVPADFLGDFGYAAPSVFRPSTGEWLTWDARANAATVIAELGGRDDVPIPGDYQAVGHAQAAVYRPSTQEWLIEGGVELQFGGRDDIAVPAHYLAANRLSIAVFRPSTAEFFIRTDDGGAIVIPCVPGIPVPASYDKGNKLALPAVYNSTTRTFTKCTKSGVADIWTAPAGPGVAIPAPGNYSEFETANPAVFRPTTGKLTFALNGRTGEIAIGQRADDEWVAANYRFRLGAR